MENILLDKRKRNIKIVGKSNIYQVSFHYYNYYYVVPFRFWSEQLHKAWQSSPDTLWKS